MKILKIFSCILLASSFSFTTVQALLRCHTCTSDTNENCAKDPANLTNPENCYRFDTKCFTLELKGAIIRGCESEVPNECDADVKTCNTIYCDTEGCNREIYPKTKSTLKCIHCTGSGCVNADGLVSTECTTNVKEDLECYTYAIHDKFVMRGCLSEGSSICENGSCNTCNTDGCNNKLYVKPEPKLKCIHCSGKDCVTASESMAETCNKNVKGDKCYTYAINKNNVFRGCLSDEESLCANGSCVTCNTAACNKELPILSEGKLKCIHCTGKDCATVTGFPAKECENYDMEEQCYTFGCGENFAMRGCVSDADSPCKDESCNTCKTDGCNKEVYVKPESTILKCIDCSGKECVTASGATATECKKNVKGDECYTLAFGDNFAMRGCVSDNNSPCADGSCNTCKKDGCNNELYVKPEPGLKCIQCSGKNCVTVSGITPENCKKRIKGDECYTYAFSKNHVIRGCLSDEETPCADGSCVTCNTDGCNKELPIVPEAKLKCMHCTGKDCVTISGSVAKECENNVKGDQCYTFSFGENFAMRGCVSDEDSPCKDESCNICKTDGCNKEVYVKPESTILKCIDCSGKDCVTASGSTATECKKNVKGDECYTLAFGDNFAMRGCVSDNNSPCADGSCNTCKTDGCNNELYVKPEPGLKCIQCNGKNCASVSGMMPENCKKNVKGDECYTYAFSENIVFRGCLSDEESPCADGSCVTCNTDGCNKELPILPEAKLKCIHCTGKDCVTISGSVAKECENNVKGDQCYTFSFGENFAMRGCVSDEDSPCKDESCNICKTDGCNKEVYVKPESTILKCIDCSGKECVTASGATATECKKNVKGDECYTLAFGDNFAMRGCVSDNNSPCANGSCNTCKTDGCNNELYVKPEPGLKCILCNGKNCVSVSGMMPENCKRNVKGDECYTYAFSENIVFRGCLSDEESPCADGSCVTCNTDGCNKELPILPEAKLKCIHCTGKDCVTISGSVAEECENNVKGDQCYTFAFGENFGMRGCVSDADSPCKDESCNTCETDGCNNKLYVKPESTILKCIHCSGKDCLTVSGSTATECEKNVKGDECYTLPFNAFFVVRGCVSDNNSPCADGSCNTCKTDGCNNEIYVKPEPGLKCIHCTGKDCGTISGSVAKECENNVKGDQCYTFAFGENFAMRGCVSDADSPCKDESCNTCETDGCNKEEYVKPEPGLKCIQCNGKNCVSVSGMTPENCKKNVKGDECYTYAFSENIVFRGCISDEESPCADGSCVTCNTDGCNKELPIVPEAKLKCIHCTGKDCITISGSVAKECKNNVKGDQCYTFAFGENFAMRGCVSDEDSPCKDQSCNTCKTDGCNKEVYVKPEPGLKCIQCSGKNCVTISGISPENCKENVKGDECYTYSFSDNFAIRGCLSDIDSPCKGGSCITCKTDGCNNQLYVKPENKLKCIHCTGKDCVTVSGSTAKECKNNIKEDQCYTVAFGANFVMRGCLSDEESPCKNESCKTCKTDGCNKEIFVKPEPALKWLKMINRM